MKKVLDLTPKLISIGLFLFFIVCASSTAKAQDVIYDWAGRKVLIAPTKINRATTVDIIIKNVNNVLYEYRISVTAVPQTIDDWGNFSSIITRAGKAAATGQAAARSGACTELLGAWLLLEQITSEIKSAPALPFKILEDKQPYPSRSLEETLRDWGKIKPLLADLKAKAELINACDSTDQDVKDFKTSYRDLLTLVDPIERRINSNHEARITYTLTPGNNYKILVEEFFNSVKTKDGERSFDLNLTSDILTLTVGALFSRIQDRSYEARKFPGSDQNVLVTEGSSRLRPEGVALLNYLLPYVDSDTVGLAISAGPAIRFGSKSDLATLGFFTGPSLHLHRRFFVTAGVHIGEFADFPAGFINNSPVPANFGELKPVKRWTGRFAFSISFRTASFGNLAGSQETKTVGGSSGTSK
jgi:hypothetical protein